jgi:hypothetical protein
MPSITNLDGLFNLAAADWAYNPPAPIGGGSPPVVASRTISVVAGVENTGAGPAKDGLGIVFGNIYSATLNYSPAKIVRNNKGFPFRIPPFFSGRNVPNEIDPTQLFVNIDQSVEGGYGVLIEVLKQFSGSAPNPAITMEFSLPSPGGGEGATPGSMVDITLTGAATINGLPALCSILINQYTLLMTLKNGG